ncbi:MAG: acetyl-CoA carboxylase, biotin carboxyl carrier protein [Oscillospiraceae bacterium]|nr:acetyl-CoA carboxylase, biotin carboxyl carrier protein [Oscillospiraceae bacterium]
MEDKVVYKTNYDVNEDKKVERVRQLALIMQETGLTALEYTADHVKMERPAAGGVVISDTAAMPVSGTEPSAAMQEASAAAGVAVSSPMVGVYYAAPGADKEPYVTVGSRVSVGDTLCIIEAMKMMNEIQAEHDGVITEICAANKDTIEFGQLLFRIDTSK